MKYGLASVSSRSWAIERVISSRIARTTTSFEGDAGAGCACTTLVAPAHSVSTTPHALRIVWVLIGGLPYRYQRDGSAHSEAPATAVGDPAISPSSGLRPVK